MRNALIAALAPLLLLSACGGGGGGSSSGGGGGGGGGGTQVIATPGPPNVEPLVMDGGPANALNTAFVTITLCAPGTSTCQTIDHVEVDTGSSGLRLLSSVLTITLPAATSGGAPLAECLQFADGSSYGPIATADLKLPTSGKTASGISVQVIGAAGYVSNVPSDCPGPPENTVAAFGANGILGVGPFIQDCGSVCVGEPTPIPGTYYTCATVSTCTGANVALTAQVTNPVVSFSGDNNGVIVELPTPAAAGVASLSGGALVFGIGTESNNALGSAVVLAASDSNGFVRGSFNGTTDLNSALDSGSNLNFFADSGIPACVPPPVPAVFYCPQSTINLTATLQAATGSASASAPFTVVNAADAFNANPGAFVMPNLGGSITVANVTANTIQFDLGVPFFFGRNVFTAIENQSTPGGMGPYFAY